MASANQEGDRIKVPTLWLLSGKDAICDTQVARSMAGGLSAKEATVHDFPDAFHEAHNGPDKEQLKAGVVAWLEERV